jgi:hypothetical protein
MSPEEETSTQNKIFESTILNSPKQLSELTDWMFSQSSSNFLNSRS